MNVKPTKKCPILKSDEVHIWSASLLENENGIAYFVSILSEDERQRSESFSFIKSRKESIITRGILRCILAEYLEEEPETIEIRYGLWGKPYLSEEKSLHFNVSHSKNHALYALTRKHEVGIDLEYIDKNFELEDMASIIFSELELTYWKTLDPEDKVKSFFTRWVFKEAFLKALGKGWLEDHIEFEFNFKNELRKWNLSDEVTNFFCFEFIPGYASAFFIDGAILHPSYHSWDQSRLKLKKL